jgi:hypothetical protein
MVLLITPALRAARRRTRSLGERLRAGEEPKVEFKEPYLLAMQECAPKMFMQLRRSGQLERHLQAKSQEADDLLRQLLSRHPSPGLPEEREAEEIVRATLIEFPPEEGQKPEFPESPDDLPLGDEDSSDDRFPLSEDDLQGLSAIASFFRSQLATMAPAQLRSVAALLFALKRLPRTTPGVDVSLSYSQSNTDGNYGWASIGISENELRLGVGEHFYDPGVGGDTESQTLFEAFASADRCQ